MKILLVEDDANLREVTQRSLEKERYVVEIAADYRTALQKIEDYDYDCILLDIMLPDGSGLDLLEKLKEMHKRENVIILSAKDSIEDKVLGLELGADDYLPKPFHLVELNARIKSVIRRHQQGGENSIKYGNIEIFPDKYGVTVAGKEVKQGKIDFKVDKSGIVHTSIGKVSFTADQIRDNAKEFIATIIKLKPSSAKGTYIKSIYLSSTMSKGIKIDPKTVEEN